MDKYVLKKSQTWPSTHILSVFFPLTRPPFLFSSLFLFLFLLSSISVLLNCDLCPLPLYQSNSLYTNTHTHTHKCTDTYNQEQAWRHEGRQTWVFTLGTLSYQYLTGALGCTLSAHTSTNSNTHYTSPEKHTYTSHSHVSTLCCLAADSGIDCLALICSTFVTAKSYMLINCQNTITLPVRAWKCILYPLATWPAKLYMYIHKPFFVIYFTNTLDVSDDQGLKLC